MSAVTPSPRDELDELRVKIETARDAISDLLDFLRAPSGESELSPEARERERDA